MEPPLMILMLSLSGTALAQGATIAQWTDAHPEASAALQAWVKADTDAAGRISSGIAIILSGLSSSCGGWWITPSRGWMTSPPRMPIGRW